MYREKLLRSTVLWTRGNKAEVTRARPWTPSNRTRNQSTRTVLARVPYLLVRGGGSTPKLNRHRKVVLAKPPKCLTTENFYIYSITFFPLALWVFAFSHACLSVCLSVNCPVKRMKTVFFDEAFYLSLLDKRHLV